MIDLFTHCCSPVSKKDDNSTKKTASIVAHPFPIKIRKHFFIEMIAPFLAIPPPGTNQCRESPAGSLVQQWNKCVMNNTKCK